MEIYYHEDQIIYHPKSEFAGDSMRKYPENPQRIISIMNKINKDPNFSVISPTIVDKDIIALIHDLEYINFIEGGLPKDWKGEVEEVAPTMFYRSLEDLVSPSPDRQPNSFQSKLGYYFFDPSTPFTNDSYISALSSASAGIACVESLINNQNTAVALCRPPGHHSTASTGGGYCFFNNIAIAAQYLVNKGKSVSILDLDFHHGNGTQKIFYHTNQVQYVSIHGDPRTNYPFYWGFKDEKGSGDGIGFNHNFPVDGAISEESYLQTMDLAIDQINEYSPDIVLLSMGFDTFYKDPVAGMRLKETSYSKIGEKLRDFSKLGIFLEGGYSIKELGTNFVNLNAPLII
ncbi:MAG: histone deacetylase family protein [Candidatus Heimdallarchaeota archaeon]|nr:histone deacetylase family protein [Candidatus Heimdallarchaeota archaeon]MDH5645329.1 histone deacetylase family protein [Candidatus Heimdallarchaeota archaeon]